MSERSTVKFADLMYSAEMCVSSLQRLDPDLWDNLLFRLGWTRSKTSAHIVDSLTFFAGDLAMQSEEHLESIGFHYSEGSVTAATRQIEYGADALGQRSLELLGSEHSSTHGLVSPVLLSKFLTLTHN